MAPQPSAGVVLYRPSVGAAGGDDGAGDSPGIEHRYEVLLVHPGGPFWAGKDEHAWSIPKGEFDPVTESAVDAAVREFTEEIGRPPEPEPASVVPLASFRAGRKTIHAVMMAGDLDADDIASNTIEIEWPPRSGRTITIPEVDQARWFTLAEARIRLHKGQIPLVELVTSALEQR